MCREQRVSSIPVPPVIDSRRNIAAFMFDILTFGVGLVFIPSSTVLVGLASQLTENKALIGVAGMAFAVTWFLPQLFAARVVRNRPRQKMFIIIPSLIGRPMFLLIALWLVITRAADPLLTLWIMIGGIALFNMCDALAGVAWFDILSRTLSPRIRARVMTFGTVGAGLIGLLGSELIKRILGDPNIPFPVNYAILFGITFTCFGLAMIGLFVMRETPMHVDELHEQSKANFGAALSVAIRGDAVFRRIMLVRLLTGIEAMAASFYLVFVKERYALDNSADGAFTQPYILGGLVGVAVFGWLAERFTTRRVVHASALIYLLTPLTAMLVAWLSVPAGVAYAAFMAVFLMRGALDHSLILGLLGYTLDAAPERNRAMYVGLINTLGGIVSLTPVLGGLFIDSFGHEVFSAVPYALLFGMVSVTSAIGLTLALRLPAVRAA